ncbi:COMM domain-containing protein 2 isoform X1 [Sciurus carolinensis]|uniref:COMM domain-containing protein 2 isoform X1 n=1 Tax=Sciurus carolinensis TaxID=30640 RepID=UPI001FB2B252|nr:COMM domain-containing protein 2 isoform X1 [Sciurus carolinensis]
MLLDLSEEHKEHLAFLPQVDGAVVAEFGRIAVEFLRRGANPKVYEGAARKLGVSSEAVQHGVEGLTYLLAESARLMISELDFQDSVFVLGFSEELNRLLLQLYLDNRREIRTILGELAPSLPSYHSLEWRLDVQLMRAHAARHRQPLPCTRQSIAAEEIGQDYFRPQMRMIALKTGLNLTGYSQFIEELASPLSCIFKKINKKKEKLMIKVRVLSGRNNCVTIQCHWRLRR